MSFHDHLSSCIHAGNRSSGLLALTVASWVTMCEYGLANPKVDAFRPAGSSLPATHQRPASQFSGSVAINQLMYFRFEATIYYSKCAKSKNLGHYLS
jgi:hypothetical protein